MLNRRRLVLGASALAVYSAIKRSPRAFAAQELAIPVSTVFGRTYLDFLDWGDLDDTSCKTEEYFTGCTAFDSFQPLRMLTMPTSDTPIFRVSVEQVGGESIERIRRKALRLIPNDSVFVSQENWEDGSVYALYNSPWLAQQFPERPELWAGRTEGTFAILVQMKYGQSKTARAVVSLPQASMSVESVTFSFKGEDRKGYEMRVYIDPEASLEGRILAVERAMYEIQASNNDCKFGVLFAHHPGEAIDGLYTVGRAAVSTDGKGFLDKAFPIMEDRDGTLQVQMGAWGGGDVFLLAK